MPLVTAANAVYGLVTGQRATEFPGALVDAQTYEPLVFQVNPRTHQISKSAEVAEHVIPGRHAPFQEPIAGGAERITLELVFYGTDPLAMAATRQAVNWLTSCLFPTVGGSLGAVLGSIAGREPARPLISSVIRPVIFTYGAWITDMRCLVREVEVTRGAGQHPVLLLPYRASVRVVLQEDESFISMQNRRYGIGRLGGR